MKKIILILYFCSLHNYYVNAQINSPIGLIYAFPGELENLPGNDDIWLLCDGRSLTISDYTALFKVIGWTYGYGIDILGRTTFSLPDYRGYFLRGVDNGANIDPDENYRTEPYTDIRIGGLVGSKQKDAIQKHKHTDNGHTHATTATDAGGQVDSDNSDEKAAPPDSAKGQVLTGYANLGDPTDSDTGGGLPRLSNETRPVNIYVYWIIKAK